MDITEIPPADITGAVESVLATDNFEIISQSLRPLEERVGLLGDHAFLYVNVADKTKERKLSFFVKFFPRSEALAGFALGAGAFDREEFVYNMFAEFKENGIDFIKDCTSDCLIFRSNKYGIFTNLSEEGYRMANKMEYLSYDNILVLMHSLAKLHASSLIFEEKMSQIRQENYRILHGNEEKLKETLYNDCEGFANRDAVRSTLNCILNEIKMFEFTDDLTSDKSFVKTTELVYQKIYQLVKPSTRHRNVLCHGDLWASNIMFKYKDGAVQDCKFVDFQSVRYVPPAHDVLSVIYLTTSRKFRYQYMYEVIGIYYSYLEKLLKLSGYEINKIIPFAEFMTSCEEQKLFAVLLTVGILPLVLSETEGIENIFCNNELYQKVFRGDRTLLVLNNQQNEKYMMRLKESVEDLEDECRKF